jgi:hypothetical protein
VSNTSGVVVCSLRYGPWGNLCTAECTNLANLTTDRLFTGQIRDMSNDAFYLFKARCLNTTIGKFPVIEATVAAPGCSPAHAQYDVFHRLREFASSK